MPNTKTAKKQLQVTLRNTKRNLHYKTVLKTAMKNAQTVIEAGEDRDAAVVALDFAKKTLHRSATRNLIKRQNASRRISRLSIAFNKAFDAPVASEAAPEESAPTESAE